MRKRLLLVVLVGLVLAACSDGSDGSGGDNEPAAVSTTTAAVRATSTTVSADPFAIPEVIDAAYVNRVLAELYRISGDLVRKILATGEITIGDLAFLRAIYNDPQFDAQAQGLPRVLEQRTTFKVPPGDRRVLVKRIMRTEPACVLVEVHSDFSSVLINPPAGSPNETSFLTLEPTQTAADEDGLNPTPWSIGYAVVLETGQAPRSPCG